MAILRVSGRKAYDVTLISSDGKKVLMGWHCKNQADAERLVSVLEAEWDTPLNIERIQR